MKISLKWLNTYLDRPVTGDDVQQRMSSLGFPVEVREEVDVTGGRDEMFDVEVTSNRGDVLSHIGVARELAAGTGRKLVLPDAEPPAKSVEGEPADVLTSVDLQNSEACPLYTARVIRGVKVGSSPDWLVARLEAVGLRSVNNVVDVTNYVLMETGQPLHAFDMAKLAGRRIVVRSAREKEPITAIDGTKHVLRSDMLVIADAEKPVAVAGVMGGLDSEVGDDTADVLLESAIFAPLSVRTTSRSLKLMSDSSYRFERGTHARNVEFAGARAAKLIVELAGGTLAPGVVVAGDASVRTRNVTMRLDRCDALLGISIEPKTAAGYLAKLGLSPKLDEAKREIACTIPGYRMDLHREVDLIEEVARVHGLEQIPMASKVSLVVRPPQTLVAARQRMAQVLVAHGFHETITFSFVSPKQGRLFVPPNQDEVMIDDERRKGEPMLRPSVLPSLLACRKSNQDVGNDGVKLFEVAAVWTKVDGKITEGRELGMLADVQGDAGQALRAMRGAIDETIEAMGGGKATVEPAELPQCSVAAKVVCAAGGVGFFGLLSEKTQAAFDLQTQVCAAWLDASKLLATYPPVHTTRALARFPAIERDLSMVVDDQVAWASIEDEVESLKLQLLEGVSFIGTYRGKPIEKGSKSVSFRMEFRDPSRTLRHEEVDPQVAAVVERLGSKLGAQLRA